LRNVSFPSVSEQMDLIRRGAAEIVPEDELARKLERSLRAGEPLIIKQGFDPTRPDLHIGHAVSIRKLRDFQDLGHQVVFIVGDTTALVGDPTGRSELRPRLTPEEISANALTYQEQVFRILDPARTRIELNSTWLNSLRLDEVLKLTAQYTVARMLERDDFSKRHREGVPISLVEFMYPLLQAYDSVALRADVELGGTDQKFNLLVARSIQERYLQEAQVCLLMPLLRGTDGVQKMSKSYDNYVGLADPPEDQYGRTMSIPDELLGEWYELAAGLSGADFETAMATATDEPYRAKRDLARRVTEIYHGPDAAQAASERFDLVHRQHGVPEDIPELDLDAGAEALGVEDGLIWLPRLLVRAGLAPSTTQASRLIEQGAVLIDGQRATDKATRMEAHGSYVLQRGKRHFVRVRFAE
jgi:tyrosyl-tRNA synthetase